jgi:small ligand-binding sensory domain FIST
LLFDDQVRAGAVGCLIGGAWRLEPMVAQGCRPIGPVLEVEQAQRNVVLQVSEGDRRRSPVEALRLRATRLLVVRRGQVLARTPASTATLDLPGRPAQVDWTLPR